MRGMKRGLAAVFFAFALAAAVPTPESHFGHKLGTDRVLVDWDKVVSYFRALEHSSGRIRVFLPAHPCSSFSSGALR